MAVCWILAEGWMELLMAVCWTLADGWMELLMAVYRALADWIDRPIVDPPTGRGDGTASSPPPLAFQRPTRRKLAPQLTEGKLTPSPPATLVGDPWGGWPRAEASWRKPRV